MNKNYMYRKPLNKIPGYFGEKGGGGGNLLNIPLFLIIK